jgi:hypothetical protein
MAITNPTLVFTRGLVGVDRAVHADGLLGQIWLLAPDGTRFVLTIYRLDPLPCPGLAIRFTSAAGDAVCMKGHLAVVSADLAVDGITYVISAQWDVHSPIQWDSPSSQQDVRTIASALH